MIFQTITELISSLIGCNQEDLKMETTFESLGIDSLDTVEMVMELESRLGIEIELEEKIITIGELVKFAREQSESK